MSEECRGTSAELRWRTFFNGHHTTTIPSISSLLSFFLSLLLSLTLSLFQPCAKTSIHWIGTRDTHIHTINNSLPLSYWITFDGYLPFEHLSTLQLVHYWAMSNSAQTRTVRLTVIAADGLIKKDLFFKLPDPFGMVYLSSEHTMKMNTS